MSETGTQYRATGGFWVEGSSGPDRAETFGAVDVLMLIGKGKGDNFAFDAVFHVTVDASGELRAFVEVVADGPCRG